MNTRIMRPYRTFASFQAPLLAGITFTNLISIAPAAPVKSAHYRITDLGLCPQPDFDISEVWTSSTICINNRGQVAGVGIGPGGRERVWLWSGGRQNFIKMPPATHYTVNGINVFGQVVGNILLPIPKSEEQELKPDPWLLKNRSVEHLKLGEGGKSAVYGLNDRGDVVGWMNVNGRKQGFKRSGANTIMLFEDALSSQANAINAGGQVVGTQLLDTTLHPNATRWSNGKTTLLGESPSRDDSEAAAINVHGQIVGWYATPSTPPARAFSDVNRKMTDLGTLPGGFSSQANAVSDNGLVVGESAVSKKRVIPTHAFLWNGKTMSDLNGLIPQPSKWILVRATGVNTRGQIVGYGTLGSQNHAFLLTPTK